MAIPTFAGTALVSAAAQEVLGPPDVRLHMETMPGVDGLYVQGHGVGGRKIAVVGVLAETSTTAALAHEDLKAALRMKQSLCDGRTVASYVGTDGAAYPNCLVIDYQPKGASHVEDNGDGTFTARVFVNTTLQQLAS